MSYWGGGKATEQFAELITTLGSNYQEIRHLLGTPQGDVFDILNYNFGWSSNPGTATVKFNLKKQSYIEFFADSEKDSIDKVYLDDVILKEGSMDKAHPRREIDNLKPGEHIFKLDLSYNTPTFFILRAVPK